MVLTLALTGSACGDPPSEEERVLRAVEEVRQAMVSTDADAMWDSLSRHRRNLMAELRLLSAGTTDRKDAGPLIWFLDGEAISAVPPDRARAMSDQEFSRETFRPWEHVPPIPADADIRIEGDRAEVDDAAGRIQWILVREDGDWRFEALLTDLLYKVALELHTGPGGHEYVFAMASDLSRKALHEVPLPAIDGAGLVDEKFHLACRVALESDGSFVLKGETLDAGRLRKKLRVFAERSRDMEHPLQYSTVHVQLAVHRDLTWRSVEETLWLLANLDVRIRNVDFLTIEEDWKAWAMPVRLACRTRPGQIRYTEPDVTLRVGNDASSNHLRIGLQNALVALPDEKLEKGIRVVMSPDLPVGAAVNTLGVVARRGIPEIVHRLAETSFLASSLDGEPVVPDREGKLKLVPTEIPLTLESKR